PSPARPTVLPYTTLFRSRQHREVTARHGGLEDGQVAWRLEVPASLRLREGEAEVARPHRRVEPDRRGPTSGPELGRGQGAPGAGGARRADGHLDPLEELLGFGIGLGQRDLAHQRRPAVPEAEREAVALGAPEVQPADRPVAG